MFVIPVKWVLAMGLMALTPFIPVSMYAVEGAVLTSAIECAEKMGRSCTCWELGNCQFVDDPLSVMLLPFDSIFGGLSIVIFWAVLIGILWLRTENPQLVGMIGIAMVSAYMYYLDQNPDVLPASEFETARVIGATLIVVSLGIAVYQMIIYRILRGPE